ncbi:MAG: zf-HC2 domain-containing protein [Bryobacteraceae bacterium]
MNCENIREQLPECLAGRLGESARERLIEHLETCSGCRGELARLGIVWRGLEALKLEAEPGPAMKDRFQATLAAFEAGLEQGRKAAVARPAPSLRLPPRWAWQLAAGLAVLAIGLVAGRSLAPRPSVSPEIAQLQGQVESLHQLVALSLMQQQQSPASRIEGVTYAYRMAQPDPQVELALLYAAGHDSNVNVRLSAVDALERYVADPNVQRALPATLAAQDSPLAQVALIDLAVKAKDRDCASALRRLASNPETDEAVRQRAQWAIEELGIKGESR